MRVNEVVPRSWEAGKLDKMASEYYQSAVKRLWDLQSWFVTGRSPYLADYHWPDL